MTYVTVCVEVREYIENIIIKTLIYIYMLTKKTRPLETEH